jgi:DNA-binding CsgD family transcriptional regulator
MAHTPSVGVEGETLSAGDVSRLAADILGGIPFPALVLEVPSERIVASSPPATQLLDPTGGMIVGHLLEEFTADRPAPGSHLFAGGRLNGVETSRTLRRPSGKDLTVRMWIRPFDQQPSSEFVVVVLVARASSIAAMAPADWRDAPAVVGTADASLLVERISSDAEELFDIPVTRILGRSLLSLVAPEAVSRCLSALGEASATHNGVTLHLDILSAVTGPPMACEVLFLPLQPSPSCTFVFLPIPQGLQGGQASDGLPGILLRLGRAAAVAEVARDVFRGTSASKIQGLHELTTRELEILNRLLDGDRVPSISKALHLSQSTVRNHLSAVFAKLGVSSQQGVVDLFRDSEPDDSSPAPAQEAGQSAHPGPH